MSNSNLPPISEEQLSQLMDGEWDGLNSSQCVAGICKDEQLRSKWSRYHLIRDCMKSEPVYVNNQLLANISAAIANEPAYSNITPFSASSDVVNPIANSESGDQVGENSESASATAAASNNTFWGTGLKGFAVAASVAAVTVVGMDVWQGQNAPATNSAGLSIAINTAVSNGGVGAFSQQVTGALLPQVDFVANTGSYWVSPQTAERVSDEGRLNMFLSQHLENSPTASREGLLSYSRLVAYDDQAAQQ
ncbi:MAG: sigma-E factor negative regulatory protein RseA [Granulosicoccus sp.]|jgi:sigma-E factor negative regulatory protein RseA